jgi:hypothetical protein
MPPPEGSKTAAISQGLIPLQNAILIPVASAYQLAIEKVFR